MSVTALIGAQWGDEGKGHIADKLAAQSAIVARYNGGDNAGHTITIGSTLARTHLIPAGAFHDQAINVLGAGMVINLRSLAKEVDELNAFGADLTPDRLKIDTAANLLLPGHIALDGAGEARKGELAIGTTKRGIGPAYTDKIARVGVRAALMADPPAFEAAVREHVALSNILLGNYQQPALDADAVMAEYAPLAARFAPHLADTTGLVHAALEHGEQVLAEGAQGTLLDIDHGTYPFVTSSNCVAGQAAAGAGVGPGRLHYVLGITKAYCTRVGGGPFPTELDIETTGTPGEQMSTKGREFGTVTGRKRRCGWLDLAALKRSIIINGVTGLCITKLDVLDGIDELQLCTGYMLDGKRIDLLPMGSEEVTRCEPIYEPMPGWSGTTFGAQSWDALPPEARAYLHRIEEICEIPIDVISTGPERDETILRRHPFGV
jgi:adenylosuccinate synthase